MNPDKEQHQPEGHAVSPEATLLYARLTPDYKPAPDDPALQELLKAQLVAPVPNSPGTYARIDPRHSERHHIEQIVTRVTEAMAELRSLPDFFDSLPRTVLEGLGGITLLDNIDSANAAISAAAAASQTELLTSHPAPRPADRIAESRSRDVDLAARGISVRTIYAHASRARMPETAWAEQISSRGGEIRTLTPPFERMIIVDNTHVFFSDHLDTPTPDKCAWLATHPAVVAVMRAVFDQQWMRATPWLGDSSSTRTTTAITAEQRAVLRYMEHGLDDDRIARQMGVSKRTLTKYIADIKEVLGVETRFQIGSAWARHPDYLLSE